MAGSTYTITLIDRASAAAKRVDISLEGVARASHALAAAMATGTRAEKAAAREALRLAQVQARLERQLMGTATAAVRNSKALDRVAGSSSKGARRMTTDWLGAAKGLGIAVAAGVALAGVGIRAARSWLEAAGNAQTFERNFNRIAPGELEETRALVKRLGLDLEAGETAALKLRTTFDKFTANKFLEVFRGLNLTAGELDRATLAISQIQGRGKLQAEELNQFVEAVPGVDRGRIVDNIAKEMQITRDEASKKLQKGQVSADVGIRALVFGALESRKMLGPEETRSFAGLNTAIQASSGDINVQLANVDNRITELKRNLGTKLAETGFIDDLGRLVTVLERVANAAMTAYTAVRQFTASPVEALTGKVENPGPKTDVASPMERFMLEHIRPLVMSAEEIAGIEERSVAMGAAVDAGMARGLTQGQAIAAVQNMASNVIAASETQFGIQSPSKVFAAQGEELPAGLAVGIDEGADLAFDSIAGMADGAIAEAEMAAGAGVNSTAMANLGASAGASMGQSAAAGRGAATVGPVTVQINVDGSKGADSTVQAIHSFFENDFAALLERQLEGSGA
jgi:tape measure domain-containing protein